MTQGINKELKVSDSILIHAKPEEVWDALINPAKIKQYLFGTNTSGKWKPGNEIRFEGEFDGQEYSDKGLVQKVDPYNALSYTYWTGFSGLPDSPENYSLVEYQLQQTQKGTMLTWSQKGFVSEEGRAHSETAVKSILTQIKTIVESGKDS